MRVYISHFSLMWLVNGYDRWAGKPTMFEGLIWGCMFFTAVGWLDVCWEIKGEKQNSRTFSKVTGAV